jgi:hypothetical protein
MAAAALMLTAASAHAQSLPAAAIDANLHALQGYRSGQVINCLARQSVRFPADNSATALEDCDVPDEYAAGAVAFMAGRAGSNGSAWVDRHCKAIEGGGYRCEWHGVTEAFR